MPAASSQLTGATNTLSIETMVDGYFAANPTLRSFHLDLPVSIRGNLADIAGLQLSIMDKSNVRLPTCTADLRSASIVNDACRY
jgi:hypothetical protein